MNYTLHQGDCLEVMRGMANNSVDSIVTDPPYELGFMGKGWDRSGIANNVEVWKECLRVLKPGGHLLAFGGSRTYHRMACSIEDSGFEIRDQIMWVYGSGFPKSLDVSKAIDKSAGAEREIIEHRTISNGVFAVSGTGKEQEQFRKFEDNGNITEPSTEAARQWQGWGTALKPAHEPICVARKPIEGTVAQNVLKYGVGGLNIDGCRIPTSDYIGGGTYGGIFSGSRDVNGQLCNAIGSGDKGRWPANFIHDGLDNEWSRFFYCSKANKSDRNEGIEDFDKVLMDTDGQNRNQAGFNSENRKPMLPRKNPHPTVKPIDLMCYLVRLVTPPGGIVLDPFMGSGSTGKACMREGFKFIGIELQPEYLEVARARIENENSQKGLFKANHEDDNEARKAQASRAGGNEVPRGSRRTRAEELEESGPQQRLI